MKNGCLRAFFARLAGMLAAALLCISALAAVTTVEDIFRLAPEGDQEALYKLQSALLDYEKNSKKLKAVRDQLDIRTSQQEKINAAYRKGEATDDDINAADKLVESLRTDEKRCSAEMRKAQNVVRGYKNITLSECDLSGIYFVIDPSTLNGGHIADLAVFDKLVLAAQEQQRQEEVAAKQRADVQKQLDAQMDAYNIEKPKSDEEEQPVRSEDYQVADDFGTPDESENKTEQEVEAEKHQSNTVTAKKERVATDGVEIDEDKARSEAKDALHDLDVAYQDALDASEDYQTAYGEEADLAASFKKGLCEQKDYFEAQCKVYSKRSDAYEALLELSGQLYSLNDMTGGQLCKELEMFEGIYY